MDDSFYHEPVLIEKVKEFLLTNRDTSEAKLYVDCTLGGGGYTKMLLEETQPSVKVLCIDKDDNAIEYSKHRLGAFTDRLFFFRGNFADIIQIAGKFNAGGVSGIVMDLGLSSYQIESEEGFSYLRDTALDMRADRQQELTAAAILNNYSEEDLFRIMDSYGELRYSKQVSRDIALYRKTKKFETTFDLVELLKIKIPPRYLKGDLSKVFQALRIEVNNELANLEKVLDDSPYILEKGGRVIVVSYHSLEDRIVKHSFRANKSLKVITKRPVEADDEEIARNVRSRSAKLRTAEKI